MILTDSHTTFALSIGGYVWPKLRNNWLRVSGLVKTSEGSPQLLVPSSILTFEARYLANWLEALVNHRPVNPELIFSHRKTFKTSLYFKFRGEVNGLIMLEISSTIFSKAKIHIPISEGGLLRGWEGPGVPGPITVEKDMLMPKDITITLQMFPDMLKKVASSLKKELLSFPTRDIVEEQRYSIDNPESVQLFLEQAEEHRCNLFSEILPRIKSMFSNLKDRLKNPF
jgi:hypothetical protein